MPEIYKGQQFYGSTGVYFFKPALAFAHP